MTKKGLGYYQKHMLSFLEKYHGQGSIHNDFHTHRVAKSLARRGLITIDTAYTEWTVRLAGRTY